MKANYALELTLFFPSEEKAEIVLKAVSGKKKAFERRSQTEMNRNKNVLCLKINAVDATALKASVNSYLKLIKLSNSLIEAN